MTIAEQYKILNADVSYVQLDRPCTIGDGIIALTRPQEQEFIKIYDRHMNSVNSTLFIPASGAASRMFKDISGPNAKLRNEFIKKIEQFPFYPLLVREYKSVSDNLSFEEFLTAYVSSVMSNLPKGLIVFSSSGEKEKTAFEEHVEDAINLFDEQIQAHFTVPEKYVNDINTLLKKLTLRVLSDTKKKANLSLSVQKKETDTISIYRDGTQVIQHDGSVLTRPAGHGALLDNMIDLSEEMVFIHNIDNTSTIANRAQNIYYKKVMAGLLLQTRNQIFDLLQNLQQGIPIDINQTNIQELLQGLGIHEKTKSQEFLSQALNKPIRVCGVVKNDGQPGGGPFWVKHRDGVVSKQIVESAEINMKDEKQKHLFELSTHFNPVNMVCYWFNFEGKPFDLKQFTDLTRCMVTWKTHDGKDIKVLEYPGLWNGSMSDWLTLFVEIPLETFKPVKTVFDLLKK